MNTRRTPRDLNGSGRIDLTLPWSPTVNTYYTVARGRKILSKRGRAYKAEARERLLAQGALVGLCGPIEVWMTAYPPDRRKRDLDNLVKPVFDALTDYGVWGDDSQIDAFSITRGSIEKGGRIEVGIRRLL